MRQRRGFRGLGGAVTKRAFIWIAVLVIVLVVVDVVLVALALSRTAPESNGTPGPVPTFTSTPAPSGSRAATPAPTAGASAAPASAVDGAAGRLLSAVDGAIAWRSTRTQCGGSTLVERTSDGGVTWQTVDLDADVDAVFAVRAQAGTVSLLVGVGTDCAPAVRTTTDDGVTWKAGATGAAGAGITPAGIVLRAGVVPSPCADPREAFQGTYTAAVVCPDGVVQWRQGAGAWVAVPVAGVRSLTDAGNSYTLARTGVAGCSGVSVDSLPATGVTTATKTTTIGCAPRADGSGTTVPVISRAGVATWLWVGSNVTVSKDGGATW